MIIIPVFYPSNMNVLYYGVDKNRSGNCPEIIMQRETSSHSSFLHCSLPLKVQTYSIWFYLQKVCLVWASRTGYTPLRDLSFYTARSVCQMISCTLWSIGKIVKVILLQACKRQKVHKNYFFISDACVSEYRIPILWICDGTNQWQNSTLARTDRHKNL